MTTQTPIRGAQPTRGPVRAGERALAPDLARGAMLLIIALAHAPGVFFNNQPGMNPNPHGLERLYNVFLSCFVHARGLPLFAMMFGYGLIQLARRQDAIADSPKAARAVLVRRHLWLFVFGLTHGILLFSGDILGAYGIVGLAFTLLLLRRGDRVHRIAVGYVIFAALYVLVLGVIVAMGIAGTGSKAPGAVPTEPWRTEMGATYGASVLERLQEWPMGTLVFLPFIFIVWVGAWGARRRILEEPENHRGLLRFGLIAGLSISVAGGLPMGLFSGGFLTVDESTSTWVKLLYETSGFFGGIGYICFFGLLSLWLKKTRHAPRDNVVVGAVTALGQRSMSGYLFQSVVWLVLTSSFMLSLDTKTDSPTFVSAGCALATWLFTVIAAYTMQRFSYRGPAETLLRRLVYGRMPRSTPSDRKGALMANLLWPNYLAVDDVDRGVATHTVEQAHSRGLIGPDKTADALAQIDSACTRGDLDAGLRGIPGAATPARWLRLLLRWATILTVVSTGSAFVAWAMVCLLTGWELPWWIFNGLIGALVVAGLWWTAEAPRRAARYGHQQRMRSAPDSARSLLPEEQSAKACRAPSALVPATVISLGHSRGGWFSSGRTRVIGRVHCVAADHTGAAKLGSISKLPSGAVAIYVLLGEAANHHRVTSCWCWLPCSVERGGCS